MALKQNRPQNQQGITPMYMEVDIIGLSFPVEETAEGFVPRKVEGRPMDRLIADCGRTCYQTNDRAKPETDVKLILGMAKNGHTSVFEHGNVTIRIRGGSRAFTHELVRHRHTAYSQESQRYCDAGNFGFVIPPSIAEAGLEGIFISMMEKSQKNYLRLQRKLNKARAKGKLAEGRKTNEDARFVLPNAVQSEIVITPNLAELRSMFFKRLTKHAQWEIFACFKLILQKVVTITAVFDDIYEYFQKNGSLDGFTITL
jgi:thymidylate synthase (FAD)